MNKNLKIILINQNNIYEKDFKIIYKIVKSENKLAIISRLSYRLFKKFLLQITKSNKIYLFTLKKADKLIGYAIFSENPNQIFKSASNLKFNIIINLILSFKFITIANLVIKFFNIDKIFFSKYKKDYYNNTLNLSYLAISSNEQSKGYGKYFVIKTLEIMKNKYLKNEVTVDTEDPNTKRFYLEKCNFKFYSQKIELFKLNTVFLKKI